MWSISRFYWTLERKEYLEKMNNLPKHHVTGSQDGRGPMPLYRLHRLKACPADDIMSLVMSYNNIFTTNKHEVSNRVASLAFLRPNSRYLAFFKWFRKKKWCLTCTSWLAFFGLFDGVAMKTHCLAFCKTSGSVVAVGLELLLRTKIFSFLPRSHSRIYKRLCHVTDVKEKNY